MPKRILSVSYDESLLATRQMLLERHGYEVVSALDFTQAIYHCKSAGFNLFILSHSIPIADKQQLIKVFRKSCPGPILALRRIDEELVESDFHVFADKPEQLIQSVAEILRGKINPSKSGLHVVKRRNKMH